MHREDEHGNLGKFFGELLGERDAVHAAHADVHQCQIGCQGTRGLQGGFGVAGFTHHFEMRHGFQPHAHAIAHERVVVDEEQFDGHG